MKTKRCFTCKEEKSMEEFGRNRSKHDGRTNECKVCKVLRSRAYRLANPNKVKESRKVWREEHEDERSEYNRAYRLANADRIRRYREGHAEEHRESCRKWRAANSEEVSEYRQKWRVENGEKERSHKRVNREVKQGRMKRVTECECEDCGGQAQHYHHEDYDKPLEVVALCCSCHYAVHAMEGLTIEGRREVILQETHPIE